MTSPPVPSVLNPDIPPLPCPEVLTPPGDRSLSPDNSAGAPNKRSRTVFADDMDVKPTTPPSTPACGLGPNTSSGLPVNKVTVITRPQTDTSLDSSIHAHPQSTPTTPTNNDKGKSVAFDVPIHQPSLTATLLPSSPLLPDSMLWPIFMTRLMRSKKNSPLIAPCVTKWIETSPDIPLMVPVLIVKDQETTKESFRREYVAILVGISKNIKEADLLEIASQVKAKAVNIPLSYNSYKPKPYTYLNFVTFESLEAAKELSINFRGKGCGRHGYSPFKCNPLPARKTNDHLNKLYIWFNAGPK
ncbi:unnamed protein product [Rhizophagus irregularis]|nr:unnamed protein product [Rhizophagus irregularis]